MRVPDGDRRPSLRSAPERFRKAGEIRRRLRRLDRDLADPVIGAAVDRQTRAVRPAVAELRQHVGEHRPELRLKRLILQEKTDNAAHLTVLSSASGKT